LKSGSNNLLTFIDESKKIPCKMTLKQIKKLTICIAISFTPFMCVTAQTTKKAGTKITKAEEAAPAQMVSAGNPAPLDYTLNAVLWQQRSGEYRALCYQAFSLAKMKLDEKIAMHTRDGMSLAIVADIDETILDNSPQQASDILNNRAFTEANWKDWTSKSIAGALPGSVAFFQYADKMGIQCFYVSNRSRDDRDVTIKNLLAAGFPQADTIHVMMRDTTSNKEYRRLKIRKDYNIALLIGDNLNDFDRMFYKQPASTRCNLVIDNSELFGDIFIILPNPMYGDWESAIWSGKKVTPEEINTLKREALVEY
jgi:5'-nucleotidase (lipoprotein e(P4) family)